MNSGLLKVASGLRLIFIGLMLMLLDVAIGVVGIIVIIGAAGAGAGAGARGGGAQALIANARVFLILLGVVYLVGLCLDLIGRLLCLATPDNLGSAKALIITSVVFQLGAHITGFIQFADNIGILDLPTKARMALALISALASGIALVLFILFIRSVCRWIRRYDLADRAGLILKMWIWCIISYVLMLAITLVAALAGVGRGAAGLVAIIVIIYALVVVAVMIAALISLILYAMLLSASSTAVRQYAQRRSPRRRVKYKHDDDDDDRPRQRKRRDADADDDDRPRRRKRRDADDDDDDDDDYGDYGSRHRWERS